MVIYMSHMHVEPKKTRAYIWGYIHRKSAGTLGMGGPLIYQPPYTPYIVGIYWVPYHLPKRALLRPVFFPSEKDESLGTWGATFRELHTETWVQNGIGAVQREIARWVVATQMFFYVQPDP